MPRSFVLIAVLTMTVRLEGAGCPDFTPQGEATAKITLPGGIVIADLDRDGRLDRVVSDETSGVLHFDYRDPGGWFSTSISEIDAPRELVAADFDRDGDLDVAVVTANAVLTFENSGSRTFLPDASIVMETARGVATVDFNRDGVPDLATLSEAGSTIHVFPGVGDGTFGSPLFADAGVSPISLVAADFNLDGYLDFAAGLLAGSVKIVLGGPGSLFPVAGTFGTGGEPRALAVGDLNRDGIPDLAVSSNEKIATMLGNGDGTFATEVDYLDNGPSNSLAFGDVNGDGISDLIAQSAVLQTALFLGDGAALSEPTSLPFASRVVAAGDVNGDAKTDILIGADSVEVEELRNTSICELNCGGSFAVRPPAATGSNPFDLASGDFDRDGIRDIAVTDPPANNVEILRGLGDGTFDVVVSYAIGATGDRQSLVIRDFNRDGDLDLAVATNAVEGNIAILFGSTGATVEPPIHHATSGSPAAITAADFDRDGEEDVAVANGDSSSISIFLSTGGALLEDASYAVGGPAFDIVAADFNGDGIIDLATPSSGSTVSTLSGAGNGTFSPAVHHAVCENTRGLATGDLNRDGRTDLVVACFNVIVPLFSQPDGSFAEGNQFGVPAGTQSVAVADVNNDGIEDVVTSAAGSPHTTILHNDGNGDFFTPVSFDIDSTGFLAVDDFNRDGNLDLAATGAGSVSVALQECPPPDLTVSKTDDGSFEQGQAGRYTITVTNVGVGPTTGVVWVTDILPDALTARAIAGDGWICDFWSPQEVRCARSDALAAGWSYPVIVLDVDIAGDAPATVLNTVSVAAIEFNPANDTSTDEADVAPQHPDLVIAKSHAGSFTQGDVGRVYSIVVSNRADIETSGQVTLTDTLPAGLTATAISGSGWACMLETLQCTRSDSLPGGQTWPPVRVTVDVSATAAHEVVNVAAVSGGGEVGDVRLANNTARDVTPIQSSANCGLFNTASPVIIGDVVLHAGAADFNGDSALDLVVATDGIFLKIEYGNGRGGFTPGPELFHDGAVRLIAAGDFNSDDDPDIAAVDHDGGIGVYLGDGFGEFSSPIGSALDPFTTSMTIGDFDRDGNLDVAVTNASTVLVLIGRGDGTFDNAVPYEAGSPESVVAGDFNRDGIIDLAAGDAGSNSVSILIGNGDGTFADPAKVPAGSSSSQLRVGDFDNDGVDDLAVALPALGSGTIAILSGSGDGSFAPPVLTEVGGSPSLFTSADFNGDGNADLAFVYEDTLAIFPGGGDGTFGESDPSTMPINGLNFILAADFNQDGKPDLMASASSVQGFGVALAGCPDVIVTKSHSGDFTQGQSGAAYTLLVENTGDGQATGVTVTDTLPSGLTATGISGAGWTCTLATVSCTMAAPLPKGGVAEAIIVTVDVSPSAAANVVNTATVSALHEPDTTDNTDEDPTVIVQMPDLTITKSHEGSFAHSQSGRTYAIVVTNSGGAATSGTVTITDVLPAGLVATGISGAGWSCSSGTLSCTRGDALGPGASYPAVTLTVHVSSTAPSEVINTVTVSGGSETFTSNNTANDPTVILITPVNFSATAISMTQAALSWAAVPGASNYQVFRRSSGDGFTLIAMPIDNEFLDTGLAAGTAYVYKVRAVDINNVTPDSVPDLASTIFFTDEPITQRQTLIRAVHITEIRDAINAVRAAAGSPAAEFEGEVAPGATIEADHIVEMRSLLDAARASLGLTAAVFADTGLGSGTMIKAAHIRDLRAAVK